MMTWTPMQWPETWKDPAALDLLKGTAIDYLLIAKGDEFSPVRARAQQLGIHVAEPDGAPAGVQIVKGAWPGVQMGRGGGGGASAGPTGVPWVDSNGWNIRLNGTLHPGVAVWVNAPPAERAFVTADSYLIAIADSATYGGRWIISLDAPLAAGLAGGKPEALATWKKLTAAAGFFAAHQNWPDYAPMAVAGVISDFTGANEYFSNELLNLMGRAGLHYRILPKDKISASSFASLRAVSYTDETPPSAELRKQILAFVQAGGLLIAAPKWGEVSGTPVPDVQRPGFTVRALGKGKIALADDDPNDPFAWAADAALLVSHRYDLVRFWNGGAACSFCTLTPDRKQALVHLLFYAARGPDSATVRIAGKYRAARASTVDNPSVANLVMQPEGNAVEVHLPPVSQYVALELDI
jgi:hypothetical protein